MAADATNLMQVEAVQKNIIDNYFNQLKTFGYLNDKKLFQVLFSVLLLESVIMFGDFLTSDFKRDVDRIMRKLECCNCSISWSSENLSSPFYVIGEWTQGVAPHTHIIAEIIGLQARLDEINAKIKKVDAKANAGL